jgi:hypothetical protein
MIGGVDGRHPEPAPDDGFRRDDLSGARREVPALTGMTSLGRPAELRVPPG